MGALTLVVTGATGFLGRYVVAEALRRGHGVRALTRQASVAAAPEQRHECLEWRCVDMGDGGALEALIRGADAVIHLAAAKSGTLDSQIAGTVENTRRLLEAMDCAGVGRIVLVGSFSVYDYQAIGAGETLDEAAPVEACPERRDAYARAKLLQERCVREYAGSRGWSCSILRAGAIYGKNHLWTARLGASVKGRLWLRIGNDAPLPLVYVENCAQAVVLAAELGVPGCQVLNVVDDNPPAQKCYAELIRPLWRPRPFVLAVPRGAVRMVAGVADAVNRAFFRGRAKVPGLLGLARFDARFKPLCYDNRRAKEALGWRPRYSLAEALERAVRDESALLEVAHAAGHSLVAERGD